MTCIVGVIGKDKTIYLGGDSAGCSSIHLRIRQDPKVFKKGGMVFGYTSSFRMGQLIRFKLEMPKQPKNMADFKYMCTLFMDAVRKCLKDEGYAEIKDNVEKIGTFIVGYKGELYEITNDLQVGVLAVGYNACGCGETYALGSLATSSKNSTLSPKKRVLEALRVAEQFSGSVRRPFKVLELKYKEK